jgi:hypothetical protein
MSWTEGYVTEIEYTHGYYRELAPAQQRFALLMAGYAPPPENGAYLELGFGQGLSAVIHAAASASPIWGTDFNPSHALHARGLLSGSRVDATLFDQSFAEIAERDDLPKFQYISLHGIWSWISDDNRHRITEVLRKHLDLGGVAYVSYNSSPGWNPGAPLRDLLLLHSDMMGAEAQGLPARLGDAIKFAQSLVDNGALFFKAYPLVAEKLKNIGGQNRNYLSHEYLNREWHIMGISEMANWLSPAKLEFAASAHLLDHIDAINVTAEGQSILRGIANPIFRQAVRDFFVNQQFRRDLFVRGARRLNVIERREALLATRFALLTIAEDIPLKVPGALGEASLHEAIYRPLIEAFVKNGYGVLSLAQLCQALPQLTFDQLSEAMCILVGAAHAQAVQSDVAIKAARPRTVALNAEICRRAAGSGELNFLASPVIGGGVPVMRFQQLFVAALGRGAKTPEEWARFAWDSLGAYGQKLIKDGKRLESPDENLSELLAQAREFAHKRLPILRSLGIAS